MIALALASAVFGCAPPTSGGPSAGGAATDTATSGKPAPMAATITDEYAGDDVEIAVGGTLIINLREDASTGYTWQVKELPDFLQPTRDYSTTSSGPGLEGAQGTHIFEYKAAKAGKGRFWLVYAKAGRKGTEIGGTVVAR